MTSMKRILASLTNFAICCCLLTTVSLSGVGCSGKPLDYNEIKQINEKVTEAELKKYLKVIKLLPQQKAPTFPSVYAPAPTWSHIRSLPIEDLVNSEQINLAQQWDLQRISDHFGTRNRTLKKALLRRDMSKDQFISYTLALGLAASRIQLRKDQDLDEVIEKGNKVIQKLQLEKRPFSSLSLEERHRTLYQAMWIARVNRAERLNQVPPENINLVRSNWNQIKEILPPEFLKNPLDDLSDTLEERGTPFTIDEKEDSDELLQWATTDAIIGTDQTTPQSKNIR